MPRRKAAQVLYFKTTLLQSESNSAILCWSGAFEDPFFFFRLQAVGIASRVMVLFWEKVVAIISGLTVVFPYRCSEQPLMYLWFIHRPKEILCWALGGKYCWSHSGPLGTYASQSLIGVIKCWQSKMNMNLANIYSLFDVFSLKIFTFKNGKFWAMLAVCFQSKYLKLCRCDFHRIQNRVSRRFNCVSLSPSLISKMTLLSCWWEHSEGEAARVWPFQLSCQNMDCYSTWELRQNSSCFLILSCTHSKQTG